MFASFYELFQYLFGVDLPVLKIIKTFGFLMACAFGVGLLVTRTEFLRLEAAGYLKPVKETIEENPAYSIGELVINLLFGYAIGYKLSLIAVNFSDFFGRDPELYLLSGDGYHWGGAIGAALFGLFAFQDWQKRKKTTPKIIEKDVWPSERVMDIVVVAAISGVLGAKLFTWFEDWDGFMSDPLGHLLSLSGLTFYGGLICASAALIYFSIRKKINLLRLMDVGGMAVMIGYGVGRLGCHFSGDGDWGDPNPHPKPDWLSWLPDWAWAFDYPGNVAKVGVRIPDCVGEYCFVLPTPAYPTPVWEFTLAVIIFGILFSLRNRFVKIPGLLFATYLIFNGMERFLIEMIRINADYTFLGMSLSQAQIIALGLISTGILMGTILILYFRKNKVDVA